MNLSMWRIDFFNSSLCFLLLRARNLGDILVSIFLLPLATVSMSSAGLWALLLNPITSLLLYCHLPAQVTLILIQWLQSPGLCLHSENPHSTQQPKWMGQRNQITLHPFLNPLMIVQALRLKSRLSPQPSWPFMTLPLNTPDLMLVSWSSRLYCKLFLIVCALIIMLTLFAPQDLCTFFQCPAYIFPRSSYTKSHLPRDAFHNTPAITT